MDKSKEYLERALERGFKTGSEFICLETQEVVTLTEGWLEDNGFFEFDNHDTFETACSSNSLENACLFKNGRWAEILNQEKPFYEVYE